MPSEETDLAWLAGIFEGEGSFGLYSKKSGTNQIYYHCTITNSSLKILEKVKMIFARYGLKYYFHKDKPGGLGGKKKVMRIAIMGKSNILNVL